MFSSRLPWTTALNRLAQAEQARRAGGGDVLDLTVNNPTAAGLTASPGQLAAAFTQPDVAAALAEYVPSPLGPVAARQAVAAAYDRLGAQVNPGHLALTASSSESYALLFKLLANPGDTVLVPEPSYPLFEYLARLEGVATRRYQLAFVGGEWAIDWSSVVLEGARAVVVVSPNNPTGSFLRRDDWFRLNLVAADRSIPVIVDEVFADYPLAPAADAVRTVAAGPPPAGLTFALGGLSKSCGMPQMKLGWIATLGPDDLVADARARLELVADTYLSVGTPVLAAVPGLLALGTQVRAAIQARIHANRCHLTEAVGRDSPCTVLPTEAGWSAMVRVPAIQTDEDWALSLLVDDGLLVQPGYFFDVRGLGSTLVLSLLTPEATFAAGVQRLLRRTHRIVG